MMDGEIDGVPKGGSDEQMVTLCPFCGEIYLSVDVLSCQICRHSMLDNGERMLTPEAREKSKKIKGEEEVKNHKAAKSAHYFATRKGLSGLRLIEGYIEDLEIYDHEDLVEEKQEGFGVLMILAAVFTVGLVPLFFMISSANARRTLDSGGVVFFSVSGQYVVGRFSAWAWDEGDFVRVLLSQKSVKEDAPYKVHAVLEPDTGVLALPGVGNLAALPALRKYWGLMPGIFLFMSPIFFLVFSLMSFTEYGFSMEAIKMLGGLLLFIFFVMVLLAAFVCVGMYFSGRKFEKVMLAVGFSDVKDVDLESEAIDGSKEALFLYRKAIEKDPFPVEKEVAVDKRKIQVF